MRVGRVVRARREELGLTQEQLAERAQVHDRSVGKVERGVSNVTLATLVALADALDVPVAGLMTEVGEGARQP